MPELAYVNGTITSIDEARVPVEDRGYQFSDAVYEFIASYAGQLFALEDHLDRLDNSLQGLAFPPVDRNLVRSAIVDTFSRAGISRASVYVQISRGVAPRNHAFPKGAQPQIVVTVRHALDTPQNLLHDGARAITVQDLRWGRCDLKTVQLLPNVLAKQKALEAGADDAIFVSQEGIVREATASNLFIAKEGMLYTHPLTPQILAGITRKVLIAICRDQGITVHEAFFAQERLFTADEVFLTGTVTEVLPLVQIDGRSIGNGRPGPLAQQLFRLLRKHAGLS